MWVWSPVTLYDVVPSPQFMLYVPVAPPTGIVIVSFAEVVLQMVLKEVAEVTVSVTLSLVE